MASTLLTDSGTRNLVATGDNWRDLVKSLVEHAVQSGMCFSSGEIATVLRTLRPDLAFSVLTLGSYIREMYWGQEMPNYTVGALLSPTGMSTYPVQVPRETQGTGRTVAGVIVFVYAIDAAEGYAHDFEVAIPAPPVGTALPQPLAALPAPAPSQMGVPVTAAKRVRIAGNLRNDDAVAFVRTDGQLCLPRAAFESLAYVTDRVLNGGDPVYVTFDGDTVKITMDALPDSAEYNLWATRGRISVTAPKGQPPFTPGDKFKVKVTQDALVVDLTTKL